MKLFRESGSPPGPTVRAGIWLAEPEQGFAELSVVTEEEDWSTHAPLRDLLDDFLNGVEAYGLTGSIVPTARMLRHAAAELEALYSKIANDHLSDGCVNFGKDKCENWTHHPETHIANLSPRDLVVEMLAAASRPISSSPEPTKSTT